MSGEDSKTSGEVGEKLTTELFKLIGWNHTKDNSKIACHFPKKHANAESHGVDKLFIYNNPFFEGYTDIVHVSVKNKSKGYKKIAGFRTELKKHLTEANEIISCARVSPVIKKTIEEFQGKAKKTHKGLLVWLHNDPNNLEQDVREYLGGVQLQEEHKTPIVLIDTGRASFIFNAITNFQSKKISYNFYYPRLGNATTPSEERFGQFLPLELIASDFIPIRYMLGEKPALCIYIRENFTADNLKKAYALALDFADAWVKDIQIGFSDYDPVNHKKEKEDVVMAFSSRLKNLTVFSYKANILNLLEKEQ